MCELALDIDPGQEGGHEYPYAPMTGNLMYCMPREQTRAYLRLGSSSEGSSGSIRLGALTRVAGQSLLAAFSAFCVNDRFDYLSSRTVLEGREIRLYRPFDDAPAEGKFNWAGYARNLLYGVMVTAVLATAAVATGGAAIFVGAAIAAGMTTLMITATDGETGNVRSHEETKRDIGFAAIIGAVTGGMGGFLKGVEIFATPFADMAIKEVIESCAVTKAGILRRTLESIGMPPEKRLAYIYDWKTLALDFVLGTLIGIGVGSAGIALKGVAGEAVERTAKEGAEEALENAAERAAKEGAEETLEDATESLSREALEIGTDTRAYHSVGGENGAKKIQSVLDGIDTSYTDPNSRFGQGFYVAADGNTTVAELAYHGTEATYAIRYNMNLDGQKVLDLTNPIIANKWGFLQGESSLVECQNIAEKALAEGYNVIKVQSYRDSGINYVIYNNFDEILQPQMVIPIGE